MATPIHFIELEEMIPELRPDHVIRMSSVATPVEQYSDMPDATRIQVLIYVRQLGPDNTILSWSMPVGDPIDMFRGRPMDANQAEQIDQVNKQARDLEIAIGERLLVQNEKFDIRGGIISIGPDEGVTGYWSYLDTGEEEDTIVVEAPKQDEDDKDELPF
jgi:hypothetical protein